jgi:hypothetical protein
MEDVVAIEVTRAGGSTTYYMTWGRLFDPVDPAALLAAVRCHLITPGDEPASLRVCNTLREASDAPYFFEGVIAFAQKRIPFGPGYDEWAAAMRGAIIEGKEIYLLG